MFCRCADLSFVEQGVILNNARAAFFLPGFNKPWCRKVLIQHSLTEVCVLRVAY